MRCCPVFLGRRSWRCCRWPCSTSARAGRRAWSRGALPPNLRLPPGPFGTPRQRSTDMSEAHGERRRTSDSVSRHLLRFESRHEPLLSRWAFARRLARNLAASMVLIGLSLGGGMAGYHYFEGMSWIDAYVNASMILSGMGPVTTLQTDGGKIFAGSYALYSGLALIFVTGLIISPIAHRLLHRFHLESSHRH